MATVEERLREYEDLYNKAQQYDMSKFQQDFEKAYNEAMNYNKDLIQQKSQSLAELQSVAPTLREQYMNTLITDPTRQMALIAQARQAPITNWGQAVDLLSARGAKYSDILNKALGTYQTAAEQANAAAENAWRLYQDALSRAASRGSGSRGLGIADILNALSYDQTATTPTTGVTGGGFVEDSGTKGTNWTTKLGSVFAGIPTFIGNYLGNTLVPKPGGKMTFTEKLLNKRSNKGSGSKGGSW